MIFQMLSDQTAPIMIVKQVIFAVVNLQCTAAF